MSWAKNCLFFLKLKGVRGAVNECRPDITEFPMKILRVRSRIETEDYEP